MSNSRQYQLIESEDSVVQLLNHGQNTIQNIESTFRLSTFIKKAQKAVIGSHRDQREEAWLEDGVECELLTPKAGEWKKGKVRLVVSLEFCSDEPEEEKEEKIAFPLDEIRQTLDSAGE